MLPFGRRDQEPQCIYHILIDVGMAMGDNLVAARSNIKTNPNSTDSIVKYIYNGSHVRSLQDGLDCMYFS
jgi:hypothetical protein